MDNEYCAQQDPDQNNAYSVTYKWYQTYKLDDDEEKAIKIMLSETGLVPSECIQGIRIIKRQHYRGGWERAEFVCN